MNEKQVLAAQKEWGDGIVAIGEAYAHGKDYIAPAREHIDTLYAYGHGPVLFKPTKCQFRQFRPTLEAALSYFVGSNPAAPGFPEDKGFAIAPFVDVRFDNTGIIPGDTHALAMGNYFFTSPNGAVAKVEYTFGYIEVGGRVKINLHHSSLPYSG